MFPPDIRRIIYTTNAIESVNAQLRKIIKTRGQFPTDEAALKLLWLAIRNVTIKWGCATHYWRTAMQQFVSYTRSDSPTPIASQTLGRTENRQIDDLSKLPKHKNSDTPIAGAHFPS